MAKQFNYEVKTTIRLNMHNPDHVLINNVIQNLDPKIFKSKNQFILDACKFYIDNYGSETFIAKKKDNERAEYIRSADIEDIKTEVIEAAINEAILIKKRIKRQHPFDNQQSEYRGGQGCPIYRMEETEWIWKQEKHLPMRRS